MKVPNRRTKLLLVVIQSQAPPAAHSGCGAHGERNNSVRRIIERRYTTTDIWEGTIRNGRRRIKRSTRRFSDTSEKKHGYANNSFGSTRSIQRTGLRYSPRPISPED